MDFTYEGMLLSVENVPCARKQQIDRLKAYNKLINGLTKKPVMLVNKVSFDEEVQRVGFWDIESNLEIKIYRKMKKWERRHPITGIILCAVLAEIFISLMAEIILEAIIYIL
jgi:hypothetical protein